MTTAPVPASPPKGKAGDRIVWVDCEMTGLDLGSDALVEVACVVTDAELRELDAGVTVVIRPPDAPSRRDAPTSSARCTRPRG